MNTTRPTVAEIREHHAYVTGKTPAPWRWTGHDAPHGDLLLSTVHYGRKVVMAFARRGTRSAQPVFQVWPEDGGHGLLVKASEGLIVRAADHRDDIGDIDNPHARYLARSAEYIDTLLAEIDLLAPERAVPAGNLNCPHGDPDCEGDDETNHDACEPWPATADEAALRAVGEQLPLELLENAPVVDIIRVALEGARRWAAAEEEAASQQMMADTLWDGMDLDHGVTLRVRMAARLSMILVESFSAFLDTAGAENYVEQEIIERNGGRRFTLTIRRHEGKTPHQLRQDAEAALAGQNTLLDAARDLLRDGDRPAVDALDDLRDLLTVRPVTTITAAGGLL